MSRAERAKQYFQDGYNCAQAVALAFTDITELSEDALAKITLPFGGGMGRLRLTCGAVSGMVTVIGLVFGEAELSTENKKQTYAIVQELCATLKEMNGSIICGELLAGVKIPVEVGGEAETRTPAYYKKRPCADLVYDTARVLEEYLIKEGKI
jgi:C_GCAxxG_C_C family probable redox protein